MLTIYAVERNAEERNLLIQRLEALLAASAQELEFIPTIRLVPISSTELRFQAAPHICIVGNKILEEELTQLGELKRLLPQTPFLVCLSKELSHISIIEQLARFGANDTLGLETSPREFIQKIILLSRAAPKKSSSQLIVIHGAKGGVGATSVCAALGEAFLQRGKKAIVVDFDLQSQDLSRFLQARPFVNEELELLFNKSRLVSHDHVEHCLSSVWDDEEDFRCLCPPPESDLLTYNNPHHSRTLISIFEALDEMADVVIVDLSSLRGSLMRSVVRAADTLISLINNDPASLFSCVEELKKIRAWISAESELYVLENASSRHGLDTAILRDEFLRASKLPAGSWISPSIPFHKAATRWPGSGSTLFSLGGNEVRKAFLALSEKLIPEAEKNTASSPAASSTSSENSEKTTSLLGRIIKTPLLGLRSSHRKERTSPFQGNQKAERLLPFLSAGPGAATEESVPEKPLPQETPRKEFAPEKQDPMPASGSACLAPSKIKEDFRDSLNFDDLISEAKLGEDSYNNKREGVGYE